MSKPCNFGMLGDPRRLNLRENPHAHGSRNAPPALGGQPKDATSIIMPGSGHLWVRISGARFALVVVRGLCFRCLAFIATKCFFRRTKQFFRCVYSSIAGVSSPGNACCEPCRTGV